MKAASTSETAQTVEKVGLPQAMNNKNKKAKHKYDLNSLKNRKGNIENPLRLLTFSELQLYRATATVLSKF